MATKAVCVVFLAALWSPSLGNSLYGPPDCVTVPAGMYPDPYDCTKFYQCTGDPNNPVPMHMPCPFGTFYDASISVCTFTAHSAANQATLRPTVAGPTALPTDLDTETPPPDVAITTPDPPQLGPPVDCTTLPAGMYPDPQDCTKFYQCTGVPTHQPTTTKPTPEVPPPTPLPTEITGSQMTKFVTEGSLKPLSLDPAPTCTNEYMELALPADRLAHVVTSGLHWDPDPSCKASFNGTHYVLVTGLYQCGTKVTFDTKYVIFYNNVSLLFTYDGVITRDPDVVIHSICKYDREEAVLSQFLPIPGGLEFWDEGFGELSIRLDLFPTQSYMAPYTAPEYPVHKQLRERLYLQLQVQGHGRQLSIIALQCQATSGHNTSLQYTLIQDGCASDDTLQLYSNSDPATQRFSLEAFRFVQEVTTINIRCEVEVCDATDAGSRCAQGCRTIRHHKRALEKQDDMKSRFVISRGPIIIDEDFQPGDVEKRTALIAGGSAMVITLAAVLVAVRVRRSKRVHPGYQHLVNLDGE
ncbi:ZP domain-containing protein-like [Branchiostoma floridae x Branchiostoma belcheri]